MKKAVLSVDKDEFEVGMNMEQGLIRTIKEEGFTVLVGELSEPEGVDGMLLRDLVKV